MKNSDERYQETVGVSNGKQFVDVEMEFDTGAVTSTITEEQYKKTCPELPIIPPPMTLTNFDGSISKGVMGQSRLESSTATWFTKISSTW